MIDKSDIVNDFFKKHYPKDAETAWETNYCVRSYERQYTGTAGAAATIFPRIKCADGFEMSVQGHFGAYSKPRGDFEPHYYLVEIGFPSAREDLIMEYIDGGEDSKPTESVYGYVPISVVVSVIEKHGGIKL